MAGAGEDGGGCRLAECLWSIREGCALQELTKLNEGSVAVTVTSPPYYKQKDYGVSGQIGWEDSVEEYVARMADVFRAVWRATAETGSCFVVVGDSYARKALQLVPQRLAIAASDVGWTVRNDLIWAKTDAAPDGAGDRWRSAYEHVLFLTKRARGYRFNADAVRVPYSAATVRRWGAGQVYGGRKARGEAGPGGQRFRRGKGFVLGAGGAMPRDVVEFATARSKESHYATFPIGLVERFILATTVVGDVVLDPFAGTGTVGVAAVRNGRAFSGIELNGGYAAVARDRVAGAVA